MPDPTRADFETAAKQYFEVLVAELDRPRGFSKDPDRHDREVQYDLDLNDERNVELGYQLSRNDFDGIIQGHAKALAKLLGLDFDRLNEAQRVQLSRLAVRAEIAQSEVYRNQITAPLEPFRPSDELFWETSPPQPGVSYQPTQQPNVARISLQSAADEYVAGKKARGITDNQTDEIARALGWLQEIVGSDTGLDRITKEALRGFRDDLARRNVKLRGRKVPFREGLTDDPSKFIRFQTAIRYWNSIQGFFAWCVSEGHLDGPDPAAGLIMARPKNVTQHSPDAFTKNELQLLIKTPLFAGHKSAKRVTDPGQCHSRDGRWWFVVLAMHCGARAGELCQLLPTDFIFDDPVPHWKFQLEDGDSQKTKTLKTQSSKRDIPIHPRLLELGLREFIEARAKRHPKKNVLQFRLGTKQRTSAGASRFFTDYLKKFGLHSEGRSTHVWRHTVSDCLRANDVTDEDIGAIFGHSGRTQTSKYGSAQPLARKRLTILKLDYGFDLLTALGGPYDVNKHGRW